MSGGIFNVGSFQTAGIPYLSGSVITDGQTHVYNFPGVTKRSQVQILESTSSNDTVRIHFAPDDAQNPRTIAGNHWWNVGRSGSIDSKLDVSVKCKTLYVSHGNGSSVNYQIFAELTSISPIDMWILTGSGITD